MNPVRTLSRPLLASIFVYSGIDVLRNPEPPAKAAGPVLDKLSETLPLERVQMVQLNAGVQLAAGSMMAMGRLPRLSALVLAGSVVPTTIAGHRFWDEEEPQRAMQQRMHFLKNAAILGGLFMAAMQPKSKRRRRGQSRSAKGAS